MSHTDEKNTSSGKGRILSIKNDKNVFCFVFFSFVFTLSKKQFFVWLCALIISLAPLLAIDYIRYIGLDSPPCNFGQFFFQNQEVLFVCISSIASSAIEEFSRSSPRHVLLMGMLTVIITLALAYGVLTWISYKEGIDFSIVNASITFSVVSFLLGFIPFINISKR